MSQQTEPQAVSKEEFIPQLDQNICFEYKPGYRSKSDPMRVGRVVMAAYNADGGLYFRLDEGEGKIKSYAVPKIIGNVTILKES